MRRKAKHARKVTGGCFVDGVSATVIVIAVKQRLDVSKCASGEVGGRYPRGMDVVGDMVHVVGDGWGRQGCGGGG